MNLEELIQNRAKKRISPKENFLDSGAIDSLAFIELIAQIEDTYEIEIDFDEVEPNEIATIDGLKGYIEKLGRNL